MEGSEEGKGEDLFPSSPPNPRSVADTEDFDAVMKSDGCNAQGSSCLRG